MSDIKVGDRVRVNAEMEAEVVYVTAKYAALRWGGDTLGTWPLGNLTRIPTRAERIEALVDEFEACKRLQLDVDSRAKLHAILDRELPEDW